MKVAPLPQLATRDGSFLRQKWMGSSLLLSFSRILTGAVYSCSLQRHLISGALVQISQEQYLRALTDP